MKNLWILFIALSTFAFAQTSNSKTIRGIITDGNQVIENVAVEIEGSTRRTFSDAEGKYTIDARIGDVINYSYTGLKTIRIKVEDVTEILNLEMFPDVNELDEVEVTASRRKSQQELADEYMDDPRIIKTAFGYVNADTSPGRIRILDKRDMTAINYCILDLLRNKFAGVIVVGDCTTEDAGVFIRGSSSLFNNRSAVFDVDGLILSQIPVWLDVGNIKRLAVLAGVASRTFYGTVGVGGVVVVNTYSGNTANSKLVDKARLRNNYLEGTVLTSSEVLQNAPEYLKEFSNSNSLEASREIYQRYSASYSNSPYFALDAFDHFISKWQANDIGETILQDHRAILATNPLMLKTLAYMYEAEGRFDKANEIYKEVFIMRPNYVQSYLDMARSYRNNEEIKQATAMFARYEYLVDEEFLDSGENDFTTIFQREFNNLLTLEKRSIVNGPKGNNLYVAEEDFKGTRLVFEWSNGEAEFELMFVNPENQYYTWKHTLVDNADGIMTEKNLGYNIKEYLIDGSLPGTWKVNINYLGNKSLTPTYLKATIYTNYGTRDQKMDVRVFRLGLKNVYHELFSVNAPSLISN